MKRLKTFEDINSSDELEDIEVLKDRWNKEFATYGTEENNIDTLQSEIDKAFDTDDIEQITKNLQEIKNKYPELTSINKIWWDVLRRWSHKLHEND